MDSEKLVLLLIGVWVMIESAGNVFGAGMCIEKERQALVTMVNNFPEDCFHSWGGEEDRDDCCKWAGVQCSNTNNHVIALQIHCRELHRRSPFALRPSWNSGAALLALTNLSHLKIMDLSGCYSGSIKIPSFIGSLEKLEHLILSGCGFSGVVPSHLQNLTKLKTLDLGDNLDLEVNKLDFLYHLPLLSRLSLRETKVSDPNWLHAISSLPSLKELDLSFCNLPQLTPSSVNFSSNSSFPSLAVVDLSSNNFTSPSIFSWLVHFSSSLISLNLKNNDAKVNNLDFLYHLPLLSHLDLTSTKVSDPNWLHATSSLHFLNELDLSACDLPQLTSPSVSFLANSSSPTLAKVDLSVNILTPFIFCWLVNFSSSLVSLNLRYNQLGGRIPKSFGNFILLEDLDMSYNKLRGEVHKTFGNLTNLKFLDVSHNMFKGNISEFHLSNLRNLKLMDLSFNSLALSLIGPNWIPPFQMQKLYLACCTTGPQFPNWIQTQNNLSHLDLSKNGIFGPVPEWLSNISPKLKYLNLSGNQLSGTFPDLSSRFVKFSFVDISFNKFSGSLPIFHRNSKVLQLSRNMFTRPILSICTYVNIELLDLSNNQLSGELPPCWMNMSRLLVLDLSNNALSGEIQDISDRTLVSIEYLVLRNNNFSGELPLLFLKNQSYLEVLDVGRNQLTGIIPIWLGTHLPNLMVLGLRDNKFYGMIPLEICHLTRIQILDLSINNISGSIPKCFSNFTSLVVIPKLFTVEIGGYEGDGISYSMSLYVENTFVNWKGKYREYGRNLRFLTLIDLSNNKLRGNIPKDFSFLRRLVSLNLSRNQLTGSIDPGIGQMLKLESLDLSGNHLSGKIPIGLGGLTFLSVLDLSNNNFSGSIPPGTQLQGFDASTYAGNVGLCGLPLDPCAIPAYPQSSLNENPKHYFLDKGFYIFAACGFVTGFWGIIIVFFFTSSLRNALYSFWNWLYVMTVIRARRLR